MASTIYNSPAFRSELDQTIEKALDDRNKALLGALYRIQGSILGRCNDPACTGCPLAVHRCMDGLDERLEELLAAHHGETVPEAKPPADGPSPSPSPSGP